MVLDSLLYPLRLNADIPLRGGGAAMLQQPLHKGNIVTVILVNLRCVPLAEAVSAYIGIVKIITDDCKLLLDCPFRDRENALRAPDFEDDTEGLLSKDLKWELELLCFSKATVERSCNELCAEKKIEFRTVGAAKKGNRQWYTALVGASAIPEPEDRCQQMSCDDVPFA